MDRITSLVMRGVTRRFGTTTALEDFRLDIVGGMFVSLLGPSGCGKSTALNCLAGLLDLTAGEILVNDRPIQHLPAEKRGFGMVFQSYALFPHLSVARNVGYGLEIRGVPRAQREERVARALAMVRLSGFEKRLPSQLSGGQQQRLAIARTLVLEPALLLLDEPLSNLDTNLRTEMRLEIKRLHTELGLTTIYVTHDQSEAMSLSDQVVVMSQGHIVQSGAPQQIYTRPNSLYVAQFMGYTNRLKATLVGRDGTGWQCRLEDGTVLRGVATSDDRGWKDGLSVILTFKPEEAVSDPLPSTNHIQGQAQLAEYLGRGFEALTKVGSAYVLVQSPQLPEPGSSLTFGVRPDRLLIFPDEAVAMNGAAGGSPSAQPVAASVAGR